ncbi:hypothetical protein BDW59DRAFT_140872 [Aspergillus cavernicola]|uniref:Uncharacterized protein n=1 Tax=Aspergillus cavernicola TaxID=176166 RepID=A0ABR4ISS7_9EURO
MIMIKNTLRIPGKTALLIQTSITIIQDADKVRDNPHTWRWTICEARLSLIPGFQLLCLYAIVPFTATKPPPKRTTLR